MRKQRDGLEGAPAALVMGAALAAALSVAWVATRLLADWAMLSSGWSTALTIGALVLTVVSFPVWFSLAILYGASIAARWRRPRVRRAMSKMADRIGARAGTVVSEHWGGDGVLAGHFSLIIVAVLPGEPEQVVRKLVRRSVDGGYGEPARRVIPGAPGTHKLQVLESGYQPGIPWWQIEVLTPADAGRESASVAAGHTAVRITLNELR